MHIDRKRQYFGDRSVIQDGLPQFLNLAAYSGTILEVAECLALCKFCSDLKLLGTRLLLRQLFFNYKVLVV